MHQLSRLFYRMGPGFPLNKLVAVVRGVATDRLRRFLALVFVSRYRGKIYSHFPSNAYDASYISRGEPSLILGYQSATRFREKSSRSIIAESLVAFPSKNFHCVRPETCVGRQGTGACYSSADRRMEKEKIRFKCPKKGEFGKE
jgi:hypothetical protein